jgi:hypothetical protein
MKAKLGLVKQKRNVHAWVLNLPGCIVGARSMAELENVLPLALAEHGAWLRAQREDVGDISSWTITEVLDAQNVAARGGEFCFEADQEPMTTDELERDIRRMSFAREDLLAQVHGLPDTIMNWKPPRSSFKAFDPWAEDVRTIRDIVKHVLQLEVYYRGGLQDGKGPGIFEPVADATEECEQTLERLRSLSPDERHRTFAAVRPSREKPDCWSVRKVVRRIVSHDRAHAAEIMQRRTWLLLGVPGSED